MLIVLLLGVYPITIIAIVIVKRLVKVVSRHMKRRAERKKAAAQLRDRDLDLEMFGKDLKAGDGGDAEDAGNAENSEDEMDGETQMTETMQTQTQTQIRTQRVMPVQTERRIQDEMEVREMLWMPLGMHVQEERMSETRMQCAGVPETDLPGGWRWGALG